MIDDTLLESEEKMEKAVSVARDDFASIRTGRAQPAMFNKVQADYYGTLTPVTQMASFHVVDARMVVITPYDKGQLGTIEKAIRDSDLGVNPTDDGSVIRVSFPQLTEERRRELVKVVRGLAEEHRVAVREIRRDAMKHLKVLVDSGTVGADEEHRAEERVQKLTDDHIKHIDELTKHKEAEVMEV